MFVNFHWMEVHTAKKADERPPQTQRFQRNMSFWNRKAYWFNKQYPRSFIPKTVLNPAFRHLNTVNCPWIFGVLSFQHRSPFTWVMLCWKSTTPGTPQDLESMHTMEVHNWDLNKKWWLRNCEMLWCELSYFFWLFIFFLFSRLGRRCG